MQGLRWGRWMCLRINSFPITMEFRGKKVDIRKYVVCERRNIDVGVDVE